MANIYILFNFNGGNSHRSGPKRGITISVPELFFVGLEKVHSEGFPSDDSQTGLMTVTPTRAFRRGAYEQRAAGKLTFQPNAASSNNFVVHDVLWRWRVGQHGRWMNEDVFGDPHRLILDTF